MIISRIDLHPLGGIAGDMFAAAMFGAFPHLYERFMDDLKLLAIKGLTVNLQQRLSKGLQAQHFSVHQSTDIEPPRTLAAVDSFLHKTALDENLINTAVGIYTRLANAEAAVHGKTIDTIHFHEVSDWDSMVDIIAAAGIISRLQCPAWRIDALPLGSGVINTAHGDIPLPAPATVHLLANYHWRDDGQAGERVTPTGAAIVAYLQPEPIHVSAITAKLVASSCGCGSKELPSCANILRITAFTDTDSDSNAHDETIIRLAFEVDDMTAEELADAVDTLRKNQKVVDVCTLSMLGKKGRHMTGVRILLLPSDMDTVIEQCFSLTTTLGVRYSETRRRVLPRKLDSIDGIKVKLAQRPQHKISAKAESDDIATQATLDARRKLAAKVETAARNTTTDPLDDV